MKYVIHNWQFDEIPDSGTNELIHHSGNTVKQQFSRDRYNVELDTIVSTYYDITIIWKVERIDKWQLKKLTYKR